MQEEHFAPHQLMVEEIISRSRLPIGLQSHRTLDLCRFILSPVANALPSSLSENPAEAAPTPPIQRVSRQITGRGSPARSLSDKLLERFPFSYTADIG